MASEVGSHGGEVEQGERLEMSRQRLTLRALEQG